MTAQEKSLCDCMPTENKPKRCTAERMTDAAAKTQPNKKQGREEFEQERTQRAGDSYDIGKVVGTNRGIHGCAAVAAAAY